MKPASPLQFHQNPVHHARYDGVTDDLLTAGLGGSGLGDATAPPVADPQHPTDDELRRLAIHSNYRALVSTRPEGGYGRLYGPQVEADGGTRPNDGKVAGDEYKAFSDDGFGQQNVGLMVQIPDNFDPRHPVIVAAPSSGSRSVYGAIGTAGEWALKRGFAVAYTDCGKGVGVHDLQSHRAVGMDGHLVEAGSARRDASFVAPLSDPQRLAYIKAYPHRLVVKHAHSGQNPETAWGRNVLDSIDLAFSVLNARYSGMKFSPSNTLVIAASVSNGGDAVLQAGEADTKGVIRGIVASEPNASIPEQPFNIAFAGHPVVHHPGRDLLDTMTLASLYGLGATLAPDAANSPEARAVAVHQDLAANRLRSLADKGLLKSKDLASQAAEARDILRAAGLLPEGEALGTSMQAISFPESIAVAYTNAHGRFGVEDNVAGYSYAATVPPTLDAQGNITNPDEAGRPTELKTLPTVFGTTSGSYPGGGVSLINETAVGGARENRASVSASTGRRDGNIDGAIRLRSLFEGRDIVTGQPLTGELLQQHQRLQAGLDDIRMSGDLHGKPTLILVPRNDQVIAPNHGGRAYYGCNQLVEGEKSRTSLVEVTHTHHLDTLNDLPGYRDSQLNLGYYFSQALDRMYVHLTQGTPLPPSQVVHTTPKGEAPSVEAHNYPPMAMDPTAAERIRFDGQTLSIPD